MLSVPLWAIAATMVVACATPAPAFTAAHRAAIVDSVRGVLEQWRSALNARDFGRAGAYYSNDSSFRWYEDGTLAYTSARALRDTIAAMSPGVKEFDFTLVDPQVTALGPGAAVVSAEFTQRITDSTGNAVGFAGALSFSVVRSDSGWRFLVGHTSSLPRPADSVLKRRMK
jgi:ketosteroid isomerase-like protein